jgi:hypothetical protein
MSIPYTCRAQFLRILMSQTQRHSASSADRSPLWKRA